MFLNARCCQPSGITSTDGEQCLVAGASGIALEPCLEAIAAGDGREVMQFDKESQLNHFACRRLSSVLLGIWRKGEQIMSPVDGSCLALADGDT